MDPAVELEYLSRGVGELMVEVNDESGHGVDGVETAEAVFGDDIGMPCGRHLAGHGGVEKSRQDDVGADVLEPQFLRQGMGKSDQRGLGGGIGCLTGGGMEGGAAGDEDEVAGAATDHLRDDRQGASEGTVEIDIKVPGKRRFIEMDEQLVIGKSGIANDGVGKRVGGQCGGHRVSIRHIKLGAPRRVHGVPDGAESMGDGLSQPAMAAGDEDVLHRRRLGGRTGGEGKSGSVRRDHGGEFIVADLGTGLLEQVVERGLGGDVLELDGDLFLREFSGGVLDVEVRGEGLVLAELLGGGVFDELVEGDEGIAEGNVLEFDVREADAGEFAGSLAGGDLAVVLVELPELEAGIGVVGAQFQGLLESAAGCGDITGGDGTHAFAVSLIGLVCEGRADADGEGGEQMDGFHGGHGIAVLVTWLGQRRISESHRPENLRPTSEMFNPGVAVARDRSHSGGVSDDEMWMRRALQEGRKGVGRTAPNPAVGAVIVKDGVEIGAGWHRRAGCPHAEREAMAAVVEVHGLSALRGSTVYVTLEPCSTQGRTPPCTAGLIEAGVARVVYGAVDPNPAHAGAAGRVLAAAGIEVRQGVLEDECMELIRGFHMVQSCGRPWVLWKSAMTLDARLTRPEGEGMWLTGEEARAEVQRLRAGCEAIVTGGETVRRDRPRLDLREPSYLDGRETPLRIVISNRPETLPMDAPLFTDAAGHRTRVVPWGAPGDLLRDLARDDGVTTVLLECGGRLAGAWLDAGCIDEVAIFMAPRICGGPVMPALGAGFPEGIAMEAARFEKFGGDVLLRARVGKAG